MRFAELTLSAFRSYRDTTLALPTSRILIAGENGVGKSSVREAIRWLLTGHCAVTDGRGAGAELLAPHGSDLVKVSATGTPFGSMQRAKQRSSHEFVVADMKGESSLQQQALYVKLETTPAFLDAVLETEHFLRLHHAEAKALVLSLLDVKVPVGDETLTLDQMDARYEAAFKQRKDAKVRLRSHQVPPLPTVVPPPLEGVEAQLTRLRSDLSGLQQRLGETKGKRETLEAELAGVRHAAAAIHAEPIDALRSVLDKLAQELAGAEQQEARQDGPAKLHLLSKQRLDLLAHDPKQGCVLDPHLECPQSKRKFTARARELAIEIEALPPETGTPSHRSVAVVQQDIAAVERRVVASEQHALELDRLMDRQDAILAELANVQAPPAELLEAIRALEARIATGEGIRAQAITYAAAKSRHEQDLARHAALQAEVDRLEQACADYGPNGLRIPALASAIATFTAAINQHLTAFGWTVAFVLEPWGVTVNGRPLETYSESEQFRIGIGMQLAIAALSKLSFAIVDRLDMLDATNRALATAMILAAPVEQVLILATREPSAPLPTVPGVVAYRLGKTNGTTVVLDRVGG